MAHGGHRYGRTFLEAAAPRVSCPDHGVLVADVPWARPGAKCTYLLEDTCAWLAKNMALTAVTAFLRLSWRTVAAIVARVVQDLTGKTDQLEGLTRIGIDEIAYRKGTDTSPASSITPPVAWCGPTKAATRTPWRCSSTHSDPPDPVC